MVRVFCVDCMLMVNMYPERTKSGKIKYWESGSPHRCPHKMSCEKFEKYQVHVRWFLKDGTELISKAKKPEWELKKKNE